MANTKVTGDLIASGTITADNLVSGTLDTLLNSYLTTNTYATQGYVTTAVNNLIDAAPASLDTLNELAAALNDDANFATTVTNSLATKLNLSGGNITGNLSVNTNTLYVDAVNNRVYIGSSSAYAADSATITSGGFVGLRRTSATPLELRRDTTDGNLIALQKDGVDIAQLGVATSDLTFNLNGSERVRFYSNGNVQLQTVNAQLRFQNSVGPAPFIANAGTGDQDLYISTGGSESMRINNGGQVKITRNNSSTTANNAHLILENISGNQSMLDFTFQDVRKASLRTDSSGNLVLNSDARNFYFNNDFPAAGDVYLINRDTTFLTAKSDGNVGIGTTGNSVGGQPGGTAGKLNVYTNAGSSSWAQQIRHDNSTGNGLFVRAGGNSSYYTAYLTGYDENNVHFVVRGDGNVGIGTNSPTAKLDVNSGTTNVVAALRSTDEGAFIAFADNTTSLDAGYPTSSVGVKGDNLVFSTNNSEKVRINSSGDVSIANGQQATNSTAAELLLGNRGYFSSPYIGAAKIVSVTGSPYWYSGTSLAFYTNPGSDVTATAPVERVRILSSGGITFNGDTAAANALDDYEEGTWTPIISHNDGTGAVPLTVYSARYVKVGSLVHISCYLTNINPTGAAANSGPYYGIRGFPFPPEAYGAWQIVYSTSSISAYGGYSSPASLYFMHNGTNGQRSAVHVSGADVNAWGGNLSLMMNCVYRVN